MSLRELETMPGAAVQEARPAETSFANMLGNLVQDVNAKQVEVVRIEKDPRPMRVVNIPGHKHADAQGNVLFPNVNIHEEMADMIAASRSYEANLAVVKNARNMALQTLAIGKR